METQPVFSYRLEEGEWSVTVSSKEQLLDLIQQKLDQASGDITLSKQGVERRALFERILYRVLGLRIPTEECSLQAVFARKLALLVFVTDDGEWTSRNPESSDPTTAVELKTARGEPFVTSADKCVPLETAHEAMIEFFSTGNRPRCVKLKRTA